MQGSLPSPWCPVPAASWQDAWRCSNLVANLLARHQAWAAPAVPASRQGAWRRNNLAANLFARRHEARPAPARWRIPSPSAAPSAKHAALAARTPRRHGSHPARAPMAAPAPACACASQPSSAWESHAGAAGWTRGGGVRAQPDGDLRPRRKPCQNVNTAFNVQGGKPLATTCRQAWH